MKNPRYPIIVVDEAKDVIACSSKKEAISIPDGDEWSIGIFEIYDSLAQRFKFNLSNDNRLDMIYVGDVEKEEVERIVKSYLKLVDRETLNAGYEDAIDSLIRYQEKKGNLNFVKRFLKWFR